MMILGKALQTCGDNIICVKDEKTWGWNKEKNKEQDKRLSQRPKSNFQTKKVLKGISLAVIAQ